MKKYILTAALVLLAPTAHAAQIDFTGPIVNIGAVSAGQFGTINDSIGTNPEASGLTPPSDYYYALSDVTGYLPAYSKITFNYGFTPDIHFSGLTADILPGTVSIPIGSPYIIPDGVLLIASANIGTSQGNTVFINNTGTAASFSSLFAGAILTTTLTSLSYNVSAVPLPAALPLFGALVGGLFLANGRRRFLA